MRVWLLNSPIKKQNRNSVKNCDSSVPVANYTLGYLYKLKAVDRCSHSSFTFGFNSERTTGHSPAMFSSTEGKENETKNVVIVKTIVSQDTWSKTIVSIFNE